MKLRSGRNKAKDDNGDKPKPKPKPKSKDTKPIPKSKSKSPTKSPTKAVAKITKSKSKSPIKPVAKEFDEPWPPSDKLHPLETDNIELLVRLGDLTGTGKFLLDFWTFKPGVTDHKGRVAPDYWKMDMVTLEKTHDYIQTAFPLPEPSKYAPGPLVDRELFDLIRSDVEGVSLMRQNIMRFFARMCLFYGMETTPGTDGQGIGSITPCYEAKEGYPDPGKQRANWCTKTNHNHRRISRIIRSLRILDFEDVAQMFYDAVMGAAKYSQVGARSQFLWMQAAKRGVWLQPEDEDDAKGCEWLREAVVELSSTKGEGKGK